jgi:trehalose/maltose transport system substrate-binding protein
MPDWNGSLSRGSDGAKGVFTPRVPCAGVRNGFANPSAIERSLIESERESKGTMSQEATRWESAEPIPSSPRTGRRTVLKALGALALLAEQGCRTFVQPTSEVTLVLMDQAWLNNAFQVRRQQELDQFTKETGIRVKNVPAPEGAVEQLNTCRSLLESGARIPDVYSIDVIWPGILADNLLDLTPHITAEEVTAHFPELIANNRVNGKLVALPFLIDIGLLFYRADLLRRYSYIKPPDRWEDLEDMARQIQAGERARGQRTFWGFVWEGASSEALTCNALEWQVSEGGGQIVENNEVTVDNPFAVRAWTRAARWIGTISPPGVVGYRELDANNVWQAGQTAFMRNWSTSYLGTAAAEPLKGSLTKDMFDIAPLPRGQERAAATVGGQGYGVSRHSLHPREAAMLVRFLCRPDIQLRRCEWIGAAPTIPGLYNDADSLAKSSYFSTVLKAYREGSVLRPSTTTGMRYPVVSHAYSEAVHAVLIGRKTPAHATSDLESELARVAGLKQTRGSEEWRKSP